MMKKALSIALVFLLSINNITAQTIQEGRNISFEPGGTDICRTEILNVTEECVSVLEEVLTGEEALRVAITDNILTQAAIDLLIKYAVGELKIILESVDVEALGFKSWTDLENYIEQNSECGDCTNYELMMIAENILHEQTAVNDLFGSVTVKKGWWLWLNIAAMLLLIIAISIRKRCI